MTEEEQTLYMIIGSLSTTPPETQAKVKAAYMRLKDLETEFGVDETHSAIAWRGAELAAGIP